jgi:putative phosphonate metabolism protein
MTVMPTARYALYHAASPNSPLWRFASRWLGRDAATGETMEPPFPDWTADPRHYGFHATLKPPMVLAPGRTEAELLDAAAEFARTHRRFEAPPLKLAELGNFIALIPSGPSEALDAFAAACVRDFDRFRAAPTPAELEKRRAHGLTPRQDEYLGRWGYAHVFEEFRFHMTLTGSLDDCDRATALDHLRHATAPFTAAPLVIDDLTVFKQDSREQPFRVIARFDLSL